MITGCHFWLRTILRPSPFIWNPLLVYISVTPRPPPPSFIKTLLSIVWNWRVILTKIKAVFKLVFLIVFNTKVWKLYCYKYHDFYLFLTLSTFFIHHFHSYVNIPTAFPAFPLLFPAFPPWLPAFPSFLSLCSPISHSYFCR